MKNIKLFLGLLLLFIVSHSFSQHTTGKVFTDEDVQKVINDCPFIFEGEVIRHEYYSDSTKNIYTANIILIKKIFKGNKELILGTINGITPGGMNKDSIFSIIPDDPSGFWGPIRIGTKGIFFCKNWYSQKNIATNENNRNLWFYDAIFQAGDSRWYGNEIIYKSFTTIEDTYNYLRKFKNINIPQTKKKTEIEEKKTDTLKLNDIFEPNKNKDNYKKYIEFVEKNSRYAKKATNSEDITFSFKNPKQTGASPRYFEFDIYVSASDNSTYFANAAFRINYNTSAFGTSIVGNNKITITRGPLFNNPTYNYPDSIVFDQASDTIGFGIGSVYGAINRTNLTITPVQLLHFKIEINNCNVNTNLVFTDQTIMPMADLSFYTTTPNASDMDWINYDNTYYTNDLNVLLCKPIIDGFTSPVYPGSYYQGMTNNTALLTITGSNFGDTRGSGNVYFVNANHNTLFQYPDNYAPVQGYDFVSWKDNEIKIILPTYNDTVTGGYNIVPGSGKFRVKNFWGDTAYSITPINMPYAIKNMKYGGKKYRLELARHGIGTDSTAITFYIGPSITNYPDPAMKKIIKKAVKDWACSSLAYIKVAFKDTIIDESVQDGVSVIHLVNSFPNNTTLAQTAMQTLDVCENVFIPNDFDIAILADPGTTSPPGYSWQFDTTSANLTYKHYDFYEVILHELGHCLMLQHVNFEDLMFWQTTTPLNPYTPGVNRREISYKDMDGSEDVVNRGFYLNISNCSSVRALILYPEHSCTGYGVKEINKKLYNLNVFPNPANNELNISYNINKTSNVQIKLMDNTGRIMYEVYCSQKTQGEYSDKINTEKLTSGLYIMLLNIDGNFITKKIIKI